VVKARRWVRLLLWIDNKISPPCDGQDAIEPTPIDTVIANEQQRFRERAEARARALGAYRDGQEL